MLEIDRIHLILQAGGNIGAGDAILYAQHQLKPFIARISELEAAMSNWLNDYERTADGLSVFIPAHQIERLLTKSNG